MAVSVLAAGLWTPAAASANELSYESFMGSAGPETPGYFFAQTQEEWIAIWSMVNQSPPKPLIEGAQTGAAIFTGKQTNPSYRTKMRRVELDDERIEVKLSSIPDEDVRGTAPFLILLIDGSGKKGVIDVRIPLETP